jgi:hypothetical protein
MNARTVPPGNPQTPSPRFDRKFIEDHNLVERYLENKLPVKGARDLENWCRAHPEYLNELNLSVRAQTSLKLLEAGGRPQDLGEPKTPWWKQHLCADRIRRGVSVLCLLAFWAVLGKVPYCCAASSRMHAHFGDPGFAASACGRKQRAGQFRIALRASTGPGSC